MVQSLFQEPHHSAVRDDTRMSTIVNNAKYAEWRDTHTFYNCKLNRKEYGHFIADYISGEHDGFVLNLDGSWGSGKTEFLKRLYIELLERNHPVVYIDAWESDFSNNPLTVVSSELVRQLERFNYNIGTDTDRLKRHLGKFLKGSAYGVSGYLSKQLLGDASMGTEFTKALLEDSNPKNYITQLSHEYSEQIEAIKKIRESIGHLAEVMQTNYQTKTPMVVLIDELDRCRPTYAIEMLEVVKHFFTTDNVVFIIATDTTQLKNSIKAVYGEQFESGKYLRRFFNRTASLPIPDIDKYVKLLEIQADGFDYVKVYPEIPGCNTNDYISATAKAYDLEIRDIDQLTNKLLACLRSLETRGKNRNQV